MIKLKTRKKIFYLLVMASCLIVFASFVLEVKNFSADDVSVTVEQQNTEINVLVEAPKNTSMQFYMFSTDGLLVKQIEITGTKKFSIENLSKGYYLYELFKKDDRLKSGDIQIK